MKINKIVLDNFSQFATALDGVTHLEIDFTKSKNRICLIIGPNGSGKTSLLSALQPFSSVGTLDIRNSQDLILKDKEGHKILDIDYNGDIYQIHHIYLPVKGKNHTTKSYITLNGEELNPNGNQKSFKEIIMDKFKIDQDYLKLVRLGSNVKSMIDLTSTDRKLFMANLMNDIDVYLKLHDKVNGDLRQLKTMISLTIDRMNKLNITSIEDIDKEIKDLKKEIKKCNEEITNTNKEIGGYDQTIRSIGMSTHELSEKIDDLRYKYKRVRDMDISDKAIDKLEKDIEEETKDIAKCEKDINLFESKINSLNSETSLLRERKVMLENRQKEYDRRMEGAKSYANSIKVYEGRIEEAQALCKSFAPEFETKELEDFMGTLKTCQDILDRVYSYGYKPIKIVVSLLRENKNVDAYITQLSIQDPDTHNTDRSVRKFVNDLSETYGFGLGYEYPCEDKTICNRCKARNMYEHVSSIFREKLISDDEGDMLDFVKSVNSGIKEVVWRITDSKDFIERLPVKFREKFLKENIYNKLEKLEPIYDVKKYNALVTKTMAYYAIAEYRKRVDELNDMIQKLIDGTFMDIKSINKDHSIAVDSLRVNKIKVCEYETRVRKDKEKLKELKESLEYHEGSYETLIKSKDIILEFEDLNKKRDTLKNAIKAKDTADALVFKRNRELALLNERLMDCGSRRSQYIEASEDLNDYTKAQESMLYVKRGLSPKEGIPLHFLALYLGNVKDMANDLLDVVYGGKLYIEEFNVTATEFTIPFVTRGKRLKDVSLASQGELSFISVALSFALSYQIMSDYNIMLLDEIDGALDKRNRKKFINIMESQMDAVGTEQTFIITHNDVFTNYPIDIIDMSLGKDKSVSYIKGNKLPIITSKPKK